MKNIIPLFLLLGLTTRLSAQCVILTTCNNNEVVCDTTYNSPSFWNETYWWDNANQVHDLPDAPSDLFSVAVDTCAGATLSATYLLFLDLDGDQIFETVVKSWDPPAPGTVNFNNYNNPNYDGGESRVFDERPVPADQKYQFALETLSTGDTLTTRFRWNTTADPNTFVVPQLPHGIGKLKWYFEDDLGNLRVCDHFFETKDCDPPILVCINGLSVNIMVTDIITVYATDFLQYAEDNTTPFSLLKYGIRKAGTGTGFPVDGNGDGIKTITFACGELGPQPIEVWAIDKAGLADYCEVSLLVQDNAGYCNGAGWSNDMTICIRRWCDNAVVTGISLSLTGSVNFAPPFSFFNLMGPTQFDANGCWHSGSLYANVPVASNLTLVPEKDDNPLNGVTPLDLYKISRHILGTDPLPPYGMIAADANKSNSITSFDIIELRKLIQGVYQELPSNNSWRFIDANFVFINPNNPFQSAFPETRSIATLVDSMYQTNFTAVKIGDVDCDGLPGANAPADDRQIKFLGLPDATLVAGETVEIPVSFLESGAWTALQLGLRFNPEWLEIEAVVPGDMPDMEEGSFAEPMPGQMNTVWFSSKPTQVAAGGHLFTLHLRARKALQLSQVLQLAPLNSSSHLKSEGYDGNETPVNFELLFRDETSTGLSNPATVFQPTPNPTTAGCDIPLQLAQAETVHLVLTDVSGKLVWQQEWTLPAGVQKLEIPASVLSKAGVYGWRVKAGKTAFSGKIVRI